MNSFLKSYLFPILGVLLFSSTCPAQDTIYLKSGYKIPAVIKKVTPVKIKYKRSDNQSNATFIIDIEKVERIIYANGASDDIKQISRSEFTSQSRTGRDTNRSFVRTNHLSFSLGYSHPFLLFGESLTSGSSANVAGGGAHLEFFYNVRISKNIGIGLMWYGNSNQFDPEYYIHKIELPSGLIPDPNTSYSVVQYTFWTAGGVLPGITLHQQVGENAFVEVRALVGPSWLILPKSEIKNASLAIPGYNQVYYPVNMSFHAKRAFSVAVDLGAGISIHPNDRLRLSFSIDYLSGQYSFQNYTYELNGYPMVMDRAINENLQVLNLTWGIGISFGRQLKRR